MTKTGMKRRLKTVVLGQADIDPRSNLFWYERGLLKGRYIPPLEMMDFIHEVGLARKAQDIAKDYAAWCLKRYAKAALNLGEGI